MSIARLGHQDTPNVRNNNRNCAVGDNNDGGIYLTGTHPSREWNSPHALFHSITHVQQGKDAATRDYVEILSYFTAQKDIMSSAIFLWLDFTAAMSRDRGNRERGYSCPRCIISTADPVTIVSSP